jgi:hypothetical protein
MTHHRSISEFRDDDPRVPRYLDEYTDPTRHYAFASYDGAPVHDGPITPADILMANLLSLRLGWEDVIPLFASGGRFAPLRSALDAALAAARASPPLEACTAAQAAMPLLRQANELAYKLGPYRDGQARAWTAVTVSKVLHRLSTNIPIIDTRVKNFYGSNWAGVIRACVRDDLAANQHWMAPIAAQYPIHGRPMPLTRMADILIWMDGEVASGRP